MGWDIGLNKPKSKSKPKPKLISSFQSIGFHLLASYLFVMVAIWLISDLIVYQSFARSLYQQLDQRLLNLADAAAHSLKDIERNPQTINYPTQRPLDNDEDLDLPWQNLQQPEQSIEWFDAKGQRLGQSGNFILSDPLETGFQTLKSPKIRTLTVTLHHHQGNQKILDGYIRVSSSTQVVDTVLAQLRWQTLLGGCVALGLMTISGIWLTRKSLKPIEKSFLQLKQFTADASHELRSPLTVIQTSVAVMQSHPERVHPLDREKLIGIYSATQQMTRLVKDLLLLARQDNLLNSNIAQWSLIPLKELLEDVLEQQELQAEAKNIALIFQGDSDLVVAGDSAKLVRLFANLVENALQYTPKGGQVRVNLSPLDKNAIITVTDTGIGIAPDHLPLIFDRFWRADPARSYREDGSGLGLAIVKAIAQEHGGEVQVTSVIGQGSCFTIFLPLTKD